MTSNLMIIIVAQFSFENLAYSVCDTNRQLLVYVRLETAGVIDQRLVVDVTISGGTATSMYSYI